MAGFANLDVCYRLGQLRDVTLDVSVELFSNGANPIPGAAERMPLSRGSTSFSIAVACRYGRWLAHFARRYSSSGVARLVRASDKGCTTHRGVRAVRWQAHDQSRGRFTVTLPYTVRSTVERLSLWLTLSSTAGHDNGWWSVADSRMPSANDKLIAIVRALDRTWHRPFTTLELACLQSLV
ncbi:hypothetical protein DAMDJJ_09145 [Cupriavidus necator]